MPSNIKAFFVTGTDTGVGKSSVTAMIIRQLQQNGNRVIGCKPVATGVNSQGINDDVATYLHINSLSLPLHLINPIQLLLPVSPNIAADVENRPINIQLIIDSCTTLLQLPIDYLFVEGIGGWTVPLSKSQTTAQIAQDLALPVILVVGIRIGCINHALLTFESIQSRNLPIAGWVANIISSELPEVDRCIDTLKYYLKAPLLGKINYQQHVTSPCTLELAELAHQKYNYDS